MSADDKSSAMHEAGAEPAALSEVMESPSSNPEVNEEASLMEGMEVLSAPSLSSG